MVKEERQEVLKQLFSAFKELDQLLSLLPITIACLGHLFLFSTLFSYQPLVFAAADGFPRLPFVVSITFCRILFHNHGAQHSSVVVCIVQMHVMLVGDYKLPICVNVSVNGCLSLCVSPSTNCSGFRVCPPLTLCHPINPVSDKQFYFIKWMDEHLCLSNHMCILMQTDQMIQAKYYMTGKHLKLNKTVTPKTL